MLFNSIDFAIFLPIIFFLYWFLANGGLMSQNFLIVSASYIFYGWWDWRFLSLILLSTLIDYFLGLKMKIEDNQRKRKILLYTSVFSNLGLLFFFKYYNFFLESFISGFSFFGTTIASNALNIILPIGISFYTFQTLSYTIDVYKRKLEPTSDFITFSAFVCFFPQLVAGPIERATNLLPQFQVKRVFDYSKAVDGIRQILWGLFKKIVIADNCAEYVNLIFSNSQDHSGSTLVLGVSLFAFQIYGDFSGYSDIAIGTSRLFGFNLKRNFAFPYFSRDISEFWRRWHISLSSWFRDYLYIPLVCIRRSIGMKITTSFIIFILSGLWHGANLTFIVWGVLNACYFLPLILTQNNRNNLLIVAKGRTFPSVKELLQMMVTFGFTTFAWIFFRAENMNHAINYIKIILSRSIFTWPDYPPVSLLIILMFFIIIEWIGREEQYAISDLGMKCKRSYRYAFYYILIMTIFWFGGKGQNFIYFQF